MTALLSTFDKYDLNYSNGYAQSAGALFVHYPWRATFLLFIYFFVLSPSALKIERR